VLNLADEAWLKNVVNLTGSLHIDATALTGITGLGNLKAIGKDFTVTSNTVLSNVNGLSGLQKAARTCRSTATRSSPRSSTS
jgi:GTP:adenosylcobinamide-phosphate guanylyltransferase